LKNYYEENSLTRLNPKTDYIKINRNKFVTNKSNKNTNEMMDSPDKASATNMSQMTLHMSEFKTF